MRIWSDVELDASSAHEILNTAKAVPEETSLPGITGVQLARGTTREQFVTAEHAYSWPLRTAELQGTNYQRQNTQYGSSFISSSHASFFDHS